MWTLELFRTADGVRLGELPLVEFTWTSRLRDGHMDAKPSGIGDNFVSGLSFSLDALEDSGWINRSDVDWKSRLVNLFMPRKHGIVALYDGVPIEGGPFSQSISLKRTAVEVSVDSMMSIFDSRFLVSENFSPKTQIAVKNRSLGSLAVEALRVGMAKPSGSVPLQFPPVESGSREQVWKGFSVANLQVSEKVEYLADIDGGPDIALRPKILDDSHFVWEVMHGSTAQPHLGQTTIHDWEEGSPDVASMDVLLSTAHIAHRVYAVGGGDDVTTPVERRQTDVPVGWPMIERVIVESSISAVPDEKEWKETAAEANAKYVEAAEKAEQAAIDADKKADAAEQKAQTATVTKTTATTTAAYIWPFPLSSVSSDYGPRPGVGKGYHDGIDFAQSTGTAIPAIADGVVTSVGIHSDAGPYAIDIDHGGGVHSQYWHNSAKLVSAGQTVKRGQTIGRVGSMGYSTGPHLHLEIHAPGSPSGRSTWPPRDWMSKGHKKTATTTATVADTDAQRAAKEARAAAKDAEKKAKAAEKKAADNLKAQEKAAEKAAREKQQAWAKRELEGIANANINVWPMLQVAMKVRANGSHPLGTFWPGEVAQVTIHDHPALSEGTYQLRILEISGDDGDTVNLVFEPMRLNKL